MGYKAWETPPDFFKRLNTVFAFTVDAAANKANHKLPRYWTERTDGLAQSWAGERVFCNPPYDASLIHWVEKALLLEADVAVLLLPPSVETRWYRLLKASEYVDMRTLSYRLRFWKGGRPGPSPRAGNVIATIWSADG